MMALEYTQMHTVLIHLADITGSALTPHNTAATSVLSCLYEHSGNGTVNRYSKTVCTNECLVAVMPAQQPSAS
jgi:hypothetical protein